MQDLDDLALLREYAANHSETAFEELVSRRVGFVYSAALRQTRDPNLAGEITQAVFIILAQKAGRISDKTILTGWLFKTTRFAALAQMRAAAKLQRQKKEFQMQSEIQSGASDEIWNQMSPLLDEALASLGETDRQAVLLRFFEKKSLAEVGNYLGAGEDTARKRVNRAVEKLQKFFLKRGVSSTMAIIAGTISANSVQAAPVALAKSVTAVAIAKGAAASGSTLTLIKGALKIMAWAKMKTAIIIGVAAILATSTTTLVVKRMTQTQMDDSSVKDKFFSSENLWNAPGNVLVLRRTHFSRYDAAWEFRRSPDGKDRVRMFGRNQPIGQVLEIAYGLPETRLILPADLPQGNFDYLITLPVSQEEQLKALQAQIKMKLGLIAHRETRKTDVLFLKVKNPNATGLKSHSSGNSYSVTTKDGKVYVMGQTIGVLAYHFEYALKQPVLDKTTLNGRYDCVLDGHLFDGTSDPNLVKKFGLDEFGLELVPSREPIEMLVVEKVK
jgi:uncharacterized protein (TIGR03435 family)